MECEERPEYKNNFANVGEVFAEIDGYVIRIDQIKTVSKFYIEQLTCGFVVQLIDGDVINVQFSVDESEYHRAKNLHKSFRHSLTNFELK